MIRVPKIRTVLIGTAMFNMAACTTTGWRDAGPAPNPTVTQTRAALLPSCPVSGQAAGEEALPAIAAAALVAPLIEATIDMIGNALAEAAKEDTQNYNARTQGTFYQTKFSSVPDLAGKAGDAAQAAQDAAATMTPTYDLYPHKNNGCIVVVHGDFSAKTKEPVIADEKIIPSTALTQLEKIFGIRSMPAFYYEGRVMYSTDHTAFRVQTTFMNYDRTLKNGDKATRELVLTLAFSSPGSEAEGTAFAHGSIPLTHLTTKTKLEYDEVGGRSTDPTAPQVSTAMGTGWMPLPAVNTETKTALGNVATRLTNLRQSSAEASKKYQKFFNVPDVDPTKIDRKKVSDRMKNLEAALSKVNKELAALRADDEEAIVKARLALRDATSPTEDAKIKAQRELDDALAAQKRIRDINAKTEEASKLSDQRTQLGWLDSIAVTFPIVAEAAANDLKTNTNIGPFMLTATVTETRDANKFLEFVSKVFTGASPDLKTAAKNGLDPVTRAKLKKDAQDAEAVARADADTKKTAALDAALLAQQAQLNYDLLVDPTPKETMTATIELKKAILEAQQKCAAANRVGAAPPECASYP